MSCSAPAIAPDVDDSHCVIRTRQFYRNRRDLLSFLSDLVLLVSSERASGKLEINFSEGGFGTAKFIEKTTLQPLP